MGSGKGHAIGGQAHNAVGFNENVVPAPGVHCLEDNADKVDVRNDKAELVELLRGLGQNHKGMGFRAVFVGQACKSVEYLESLHCKRK